MKHVHIIYYSREQRGTDCLLINYEETTPNTITKRVLFEFENITPQYRLKSNNNNNNVYIYMYIKYTIKPYLKTF